MAASSENGVLGDIVPRRIVLPLVDALDLCGRRTGRYPTPPRLVPVLPCESGTGFLHPSWTGGGLVSGGCL